MWYNVVFFLLTITVHVVAQVYCLKFAVTYDWYVFVFFWRSFMTRCLAECEPTLIEEKTLCNHRRVRQRWERHNEAKSKPAEKQTVKKMRKKRPKTEREGVPRCPWIRRLGAFFLVASFTMQFFPFLATENFLREALLHGYLLPKYQSSCLSCKPDKLPCGGSWPIAIQGPEISWRYMD